MAGIYIHIPFCAKRCIYCDFFSSVSIEKKSAYIDIICKEIEQRKGYLREKVQTIYFGGGTPSLFSAENLNCIIESIRSHFLLDADPEITLEANPDDLTPGYLESITSLPFNRLSIGIQSLCNSELDFLNRRHNAQEAITAVRNAQKANFNNISIDLMYGLPNSTSENWKNTLQQILDLGIQHISAYHLIYEEGTKLYHLWKTGKLRPISEELSLRLFNILIDTLERGGFEHYEISNFARPGFHSRHNSSYWEGKPYLGIGASAHSFNGACRSWNENRLDYSEAGRECELIDDQTAYNEFILTRLRTHRGVDINELQTLFGEEKFVLFERRADKYFQDGLIEKADNSYRLTRKGLFISDSIISDLMD